MRVAYIAHPYSADTVDGVKQNINDAEEYGKQMLLKGYAVIIPHKITGHWEIDSRFSHYKYDDWIGHCLALLKRCDVAVFCGNWLNSWGCMIEYIYACELGKEIIKISKEETLNECECAGKGAI